MDSEPEPTRNRTRASSRVRRVAIESAWAAAAAVVAVVTGALALGVNGTNLAQRWTVGSDDQILHYTLFTSATQAFPFDTNDALGFPDGLNAFFSAQFDPASALVVGLLALVIHNGFALLNVFYLLTFGGVALAGYAFFRALRVRPWVGAFVAVVFSLAPYHFLRISAGHAFLANYWSIPLIGILVLVVAGDRTDPFARWAQRSSSRLGRVLRRLLPILALAVAIAASSGYYYVFGAILVGGIWALGAAGHLLARRAVRELLWPTLALVLLAACIGTALIVVSLGYGERYDAYFQSRSISESELYAGRLLPLLLPWLGTAVPKIGALTNIYNAWSATATTTEPPGMPIVASLAFVVLVLVLPVLALVGGRALRASAIGRLFGDGRVRVLAVATLWTLAFYTVTGLGIAVALIAGPTIRAWSRLSIVLALLALGLIAIVLDRIRARAWIRFGIVAVLGVVVLFDQVLGVSRVVPINATDDQEMSTLVAQADAALPDGCGVVELPIKSFPDSGPIGAMADYDEALPYLYTPDGALEWSYGSVAGTYAFDVWKDVTDPASFATAVQESGACAVYVDSAAYTQAENAWVPYVAAVTDDVIDPIATSSSGRWLIFEVAR